MSYWNPRFECEIASGDTNTDLALQTELNSLQEGLRLIEDFQQNTQDPSAFDAKVALLSVFKHPGVSSSSVMQGIDSAPLSTTIQQDCQRLEFGQAGESPNLVHSLATLSSMPKGDFMNVVNTRMADFAQFVDSHWNQLNQNEKLTLAVQFLPNFSADSSGVPTPPSSQLSSTVSLLDKFKIDLQRDHSKSFSNGC